MFEKDEPKNKDAGLEESESSKKDLTDEEGHPLANTDFISEKIKSRPINSQKLLRRTIITISMAILFGTVACCTFLILEPLLNKALIPATSSNQVSFPAEDASSEIQRKDLIESEEKKAAADAASAKASVTETAEKEVKAALQSFKISSENYVSMYDSLKKVASDGEKSMVTVTVQTSGTDWINESLTRSDAVSGLIVAEAGNEYIIAAFSNKITKAQKMQVTFCDGSIVSAKLKATDNITGLSLLSVAEKNVSEKTKEEIKIAALGSSSSSEIVGTPVVAIGSPTGSPNSIGYGIISGTPSTIDLSDSAYKLLVTDMYGTPASNGVIINLNGSVIGMINMSFNSENQKNMISAVGISELKNLISMLSNDTSRGFLGIHISNIPDTVRSADSSIPEGIYVTQVDTSSAAMDSGIQAGDIIVSINNSAVTNTTEFLNELQKLTSGSHADIVLMRQSTNGYNELTIHASLN